MSAPALLLMAVFIGHLVPEHLVSMLGGNIGAWESFCDGLQDTVVWGVIGSLSKPAFLIALSAWAMLEAMERATCRVMLPMNKPPGSIGVFICDRVIPPPLGVAVSEWSLYFAGIVAVMAADRIAPIQWREKI